MKILGLLGGTSWVSTVDYYKQINEGINTQLGGVNFSECMIYSFNFADIKRCVDSNDWDTIFSMFKKAALHLKDSGATALVLCACTAHNIADRLEAATGMPLIHIASATAAAIQKQGLKKVALLGTRFTMELDFFTSRLRQSGIETLIPGEEDRAFIHYTIFEELGRNIFTAATKERYLTIINKLVSEGAEGIVLGCTEIPLLLKPADIPVPSFDTLLLHTGAAVAYSLGQ